MLTERFVSAKNQERGLWFKKFRKKLHRAEKNGGLVISLQTLEA